MGINDEDFVITLYRVFFNRTPSESEVLNWTNYLASENGSRESVINYFSSCTEWVSYCQFFGICA